jgi:hypothetical protein
MRARVLPITVAPSVALASLAPARKVLVSGDFAHSFVMQLAARAACDERRIVFLSADNRFDPYSISRLAKVYGTNPEQILRRIMIARAFTAYQFAEMIARLPADSSSHDLVVVSGPCSAFFDEDISHVDAARLFYRVLWQIIDLAREGMTLLLAQPDQASVQRRAYFLTDLRRLSDVVLRVSGEHSFTIERHGDMKLPQVAGLNLMTKE